MQLFKITMMAGVSGFEPERTVLETAILPLYYTPMIGDLYGIRTRECMRERHVS